MADSSFGAPLLAVFALVVTVQTVTTHSSATDVGLRQQCAHASADVCKTCVDQSVSFGRFIFITSREWTRYEDRI